MKDGIDIIIAVGLALFVCPPLFASCPFGQTNCSHPGNCGRYVDRNNDGICDHSQQLPEIAIAVENKAKAVLKNLSAQPKPAPAKTEGISPVKTYSSPRLQDSQPTERELLWIALAITMVMVLLSEIMVVGYKSLAMPLRLFWNWILFSSFLLVSATSILFVYPSDFISRQAVSYWHALSGWFFIFIGGYHTATRFRCMIKLPTVIKS